MLRLKKEAMMIQKRSDLLLPLFIMVGIGLVMGSYWMVGFSF